MIFQRLKRPEFKEESFSFATSMTNASPDGRLIMARGAQWYTSLSERQRLITSVSTDQAQSIRTVIANQAAQDAKIKVWA